MKYFFDTEFKEQPNTIEFISIGIITEKGDEYYAISNEFNLKEVWDDKWLKENVLSTIHEELREKAYSEKPDFDLYDEFSLKSMKNLLKWYGKKTKVIAEEIKNFVYHTNNDINPKTVSNFDEAIKKSPIEFYAYYADYDWVVFCWLFGKMLDLPKGFPMYCRDLKQTFDEKNLSKEWKNKNVPESDNEHNAIADARWNLELYNNMLKK